MSNRLGRYGLVATAVFGTSVITGSWGVAGAQAASIVVDPASGPPATDLTVSGGGCNGTSVLLELDQDSTPLDSSTATPDADGDWSGVLSVPDDETLGGLTLTVSADCIGGDPDPEYGNGSFSVDDGSTTTTMPTTTTTSTTTTTTTAPGEPGPSPTTTTTEPATTTTTQPSSSRTPANAVTREPSFAG